MDLPILKLETNQKDEIFQLNVDRLYTVRRVIRLKKLVYVSLVYPASN